MEVMLGGILEHLIQVIGSIAVPVLMYFIKRFLDDTAVEKFTPMIQDYLKKGIKQAESYFGTKVKDASVDIQNKIVAQSVDFALENAPSIVKKAGFKPKNLEEEAKSLIMDVIGD